MRRLLPVAHETTPVTHRAAAPMGLTASSLRGVARDTMDESFVYTSVAVGATIGAVPGK